jgi:hypothetical protein
LYEIDLRSRVDTQLLFGDLDAVDDGEHGDLRLVFATAVWCLVKEKGQQKQVTHNVLFFFLKPQISADDADLIRVHLRKSAA